MRVLGQVLVGFLCVYLTVAIFTDLGGRWQVEASAAPASPISVSLTGEGALTYFQEGDGHTDTYFIYRAPDGSVATKILSFTGNSICGNQPCTDSSIAPYYLYGTYGAGPVLVTGTVENEELTITSIAPTTDNSQSLQVLSFRKGESISFGNLSLKILGVESDGIEVTLSDASGSNNFLLTPGAIVDSHRDWYLSYVALPNSSYVAPFSIVVIQKR